MHRLQSPCFVPAAAAMLWACGILVVVASLVGVVPNAAAQFAGFDDEEQELQPGLLGRFQTLAEVQSAVQGEDSPTVRWRVDDQLSFIWGDGPADPHLPSGPFVAEWTGQLFARPSGGYRLHLFLQGSVEVELAGQQVLKATADQPRWVSSDEVRLTAGYHPLRVSYTSRQEGDRSEGRLGVFWSGRNFGLEPIPASSLWHEDSETAERAAALENGRQLVDALRCVACHPMPGAPPLLPAPSLTRIRGNIEPAWLVDLLHQSPAELALSAKQDETEGNAEPHRNMPAFGFDRQTAVDVAAALLEASEKATADAAQPEKSNTRPADSTAAKAAPDSHRGEQLLATIGCLACHVANGLGQSGPFGGGDLSSIARKRPADFFQRWLQDPASVNSEHRMPVFDLTAAERQDLVAFLQGLSGEPAGSAGPAVEADPKAALDLLPKGDLAAGRAAMGRAGCTACHTLPKPLQTAVPPAVPLTPAADWQHSCVAEPAPARRQPGYRLAAADAEAIQRYVTSLGGGQPGGQLLAEDLLRRSQCFACHPRGTGTGNSDAALAIAAHHAEVVAHVAMLSPPSLNSIGDKLRDEPLRQAIAGKAETRRPWLSVQMPRFSLSSAQVEQLADAFIAADRVPAGSPQTATLAAAPPEATLRTVGGRLVTSSGFGCTSCHAIGEVQPGEAPVSSLGPNLRELGKRVRPEWFRRWVANPLRIVPRVEMPAIATPVTGVLDNHLEHQVDAVWHVLNLSDFRPPMPNPVRAVRKRGVAAAAQRAAVITDVLYSDGEEQIKPLLIGLPNRQNVVFDLANARMSDWWSGDAAYQRTEGKRWFWETPGGNLWPDLTAAGQDASSSEAATEWMLERAGGNPAERLRPVRVGQFLTEADSWTHLDGGIRFTHRLHFAPPQSDASAAGEEPTSDEATVTVLVEQTIRPQWSPEGFAIARWTRELRADLVPAGWRLLHRPLPPEAATVEKPVGRSSAAAAPGLFATAVGATGAEIEVAVAGETRLDVAGWLEVPQVDLSGSRSAAATSDAGNGIQLVYSADVPVDRFPVLPTDESVEAAVELEVVPGFSAVQLPLPQHIMPTALSWHPDGSLYVTDLKGPVWRATDGDGDGLFESVTEFCDHLATPFGIAAHADYIDVINKYALLRLWDDDEDGVADRVETLASGWGHTADYHDWAVGLPQTEDGGYYVTLACQQDQRSRAAAKLRGSVIRLEPRQPSPANPHRFTIQQVTTGHRFPIGIAQDRHGDVFVTDNQGNYKPFNELNHIAPGRDFGFINLLDRQSEVARERTPPSIEIPHPWTRSVNGICFLNTPGTGAEADRKFGPFEGHLVGCEYDTKRLVRMSLQRVGDQIQGAVYPFSFDTPPAGPPLLGPISCAVSPQGELFIGNLRESGWGAGANVGNLVRLRFEPEELPAGIAEVRATDRGFEIAFTRPVDPAKAVDPNAYSIASYTRVSTPRYGGDDEQRRSESIRRLDYDPQRQVVTLELAEMRQGFVYEFELAPLVADGQPFYPAEAFYTLRELVPAERQEE